MEIPEKDVFLNQLAQLYEKYGNNQYKKKEHNEHSSVFKVLR